MLAFISNIYTLHDVQLILLLIETIVVIPLTYVQCNICDIVLQCNVIVAIFLNFKWHSYCQNVGLGLETRAEK